MDSITAKQFWIWFKKNDSSFFFLNQIDNEKEKEKILSILESQLHKYSKNLFFKIGGYPNEIQELIITSEGNSNYFEKVNKLVDLAPKMSNWNIIALKQPVSGNFIIETKNIKIHINDLWFLPLSNDSNPKDLGMKIGFKNYKEVYADDYVYLSKLALQDVLGEKNYSLYIKHFEAAYLPDLPEENGYIEFREINNYINWFLSKNNLI